MVMTLPSVPAVLCDNCTNYSILADLQIKKKDVNIIPASMLMSVFSPKHVLCLRWLQPHIAKQPKAISEDPERKEGNLQISEA